MVIVVEIEDRCFAKPFLGGWRNVVTGTEYHDACTQTCPRDNVVYPRGGKKHGNYDPPGGSCYNTRGSNVITGTRDLGVGTDTSVLMTLLASYRSKYTSVACERATQTSRFPDLRDKLVTPFAIQSETTPSTNYRCNETLFDDTSKIDECYWKRINAGCSSRSSSLEEKSARKIQKCYRAYRTRTRISGLARLSRATRPFTPPEPDKIRHFRHCRVSQFEIVNLVPPSKRTDFEMITRVLERWRFYENARLDRGLFDTSKLAVRSKILRQEIEILRAIETTKSRVRAATRDRRNLEILRELARSEVWFSANGEKSVRVDTLRVQRARELTDFYRSLTDPGLPGRIEVLKKLRKYAACHSCRYAVDLVSLVDQEIQLVAICRNESILDSLRNRLKLALLRLTKNSCAFKFYDPSNLRGVVKTKKIGKLCEKCREFFTIEDPSSRRYLLPICEKCRNSQPGKQAKIVCEPYQVMIQDLRIREAELIGNNELTMKFGFEKNWAWLVEPRTVCRLVNYVWHGKSAISECDDVYRLALVRFDVKRLWSPWNNLVLTKREAALHQAMENPADVYATAIVKRFVVKNLQAKLLFDINVRGNC